MKTKYLLSMIVLISLLFVAGGVSARPLNAALGTGFTYQGSLTDGGAPATDQRGVSCPQNSVYDIGAYAQEVCTPPPSGMVSWWGGDNNALDMVGTNNGTLQGGATFAPGIVGQAFSFDGVGAQVNVGNAPSLKMTEQVTLTAWVNVNAPFPDRYYTIVSDHGPASDSGKILRFHANEVQFLMGESWTTTAAYAFDGSAAGQWQHIAATYDGIDMKLYVNGQLKNSQNRPGSIAANNNPILIGASGFGEYFPHRRSRNIQQRSDCGRNRCDL
jgi:hypothetical protein